MKLIVFQSDKGDCLLVEGKDKSRVLVDGGMPETYTKHVAPYLDKLRKKKAPLDAVYVSHIDEDHISGILQMMDDAVAWEIYKYQTTVAGNPNAKKPESLKPPTVKSVWHNAFHEQVNDNTGEIEDMLAATVAILAGGSERKFIRMASFHQSIATSIRQAINLSRRLGDNQLDIKLNPQANGQLMMYRKPSDGTPPNDFSIGGMNWFIIGPTAADLKDLRAEWNKWLKKNKETIERIEDRARRTERDLGNSLATEISEIVGIADAQSKLLAYNLLSELATDSKKILGRRQKVTVPNLASLMFYVEEKDANGKTKTLLLTGDGHHLDILKGLELQGKLKKGEALYVDVLKVQHHGSEHNLDAEFCKRVIAKNYVFCGNGAHENPDLDVVEAVIDSRLSAKDQGAHPQVNDDFTLWFNSSSANPDTEPENTAHMKKVEDLVKAREAASGGKLKSVFLEKSYFEVPV